MKKEKICSVFWCVKPVKDYGLCSGHSQRKDRYGDPLLGGEYRARGGDPWQFMVAAAGVATDECIEWPYALYKSGYGTFRSRRAHRVVLEMFGPPKPDDPKIEAAHSCSNRKCINLRHLRWATGVENSRDRDQLFILNNPAKAEQIREVFRLAVAGVPLREITDKFSISTATVIYTARRQRWDFVTADIPGDYLPRNPRKFDEVTVREIRARAAAGETNTSLAKIYGVARETLKGIVARKYYADIS